MAKPWWELLIKSYACHPSIVYVKQFDTFAEFWATCPRGEWLFWLAARIVPERQPLVKGLADCGRLALPWLGDDPELVKVISAADAWADGKGSVDTIRYAAAMDAAFACRLSDDLCALSIEPVGLREILRAAERASGTVEHVIGVAEGDEREQLRATCADIARKFYAPVSAAEGVMELRIA